MSVYLKDGLVLLHSDLVATDAACCCSCSTLICPDTPVEPCVKLWRRSISATASASNGACAIAVSHYPAYGSFNLTDAATAVCSSGYSSHRQVFCSVKRFQFYWELVLSEGPCTISWQQRERDLGGTCVLCTDVSYNFPVGATTSPVFEIDEPCSDTSEANPYRDIALIYQTCAALPC